MHYSNNIYASLITFNDAVYPNFGNIVIFAGGPGSGKGFQKKNLLGITGRDLDVDHLKELVLKEEGWRKKLEDAGIYYSPNFLKDPKNTSMLHEFMKDYNVKERLYQTLDYIGELRANKPNLIFDVTLSEKKQFKSICEIAEKLGYEKKNVHLVWVINSLEISLEQNRKRSRTIDDSLLITIYNGVSATMKDICQTGSFIKKYLDGDIWLSFNRVGIDTDGISGNTGHGFYFTKANYVRIKKSGEGIVFPNNYAKNLSKALHDITGHSHWLELDLTKEQDLTQEQES